MTLFNNEPDKLISTLKQFWETENTGMEEEKANRCEPPETKGKPFLDYVQFVDKWYQVKLVCAENDCVPTPNKDFKLCKTCLNYLIFRLKKNEDLLKEYSIFLKSS